MLNHREHVKKLEENFHVFRVFCNLLCVHCPTLLHIRAARLSKKMMAKENIMESLWLFCWFKKFLENEFSFCSKIKLCIQSQFYLKFYWWTLNKQNCSVEGESLYKILCAYFRKLVHPNLKISAIFLNLSCFI